MEKRLDIKAFLFFDWKNKKHLEVTIAFFFCRTHLCLATKQVYLSAERAWSSKFNKQSSSSVFDCLKPKEASNRSPSPVIFFSCLQTQEGLLFGNA